MPLTHAGDRPIEITLERVWAALSWRKRLRLLRLLLLDARGAGAVPAEAVAAGAAAADDAVAAVIAQLSDGFPEVHTALLASY